MSSTSDSCKDGASKSNDDDECELEEKLQNMSVGDISVCANCGKEGSSDNMNTCNKCKQVKYCNAVCKKVHKKKHKKDCEEYVRCAAERAAKLRDEELRIAAQLHDENLFKQPPPEEDCPICFQRLPTLNSGRTYYVCCGKLICNGCCYAPVYDDQGNKVDNQKCPFCRTPFPSSDEDNVERLKERMEAGDPPEAVYAIGVCYRDGLFGFPQDFVKALELWHRAAELGHAQAYCSIGCAHEYGEGVEIDKKKAIHYYELSAMGGDAVARNNLGNRELDAGNMDRALKHYMISVRGGYSESLEMIQKMYANGFASKEDYTRALQLYQAYLGEIKSVQRDKAAVASERYKYY